MNESNAVSLGEISSSHRDALLELLCDEKVTLTYMVPQLDTVEKKDAMFRRFEELSRKSGRYVRGIFRDNSLIGVINDVGIENGSIELGYAMLPRYWGHGYMTRAVKTAMNELAAAGFRRLICGAFENNVRSISVMERCGMRRIPMEESVSYRGMEHRCIYYAADLP